MRVSAGDVISAITSKRAAERNQKPAREPKSVTNWNSATSHGGACRAALIAGTSTKTMMRISAAIATAVPTARRA